jgi:exonuclease SbcD
VQGGGERPAHLVDEYAVTAASFPPSIGYGALGHLHRAQRVPAGAALHYCGSPLQLDFGAGDHPQQVNLVTAAPGVPSDVRAARLTAGRRLRTVRGTIDELGALDIADDPWLRVIVHGERQAGMADDVRRLLGPRVVDVRVDVSDALRQTVRRDHRGRSPQELFGDFLRSHGIADERIDALFAELLDEALT